MSERPVFSLGEKLLLLVGLALVLSLVGMCVGVKRKYDSAPRQCADYVGMVVSIESDRPCTMGCCGYDHNVTMSLAGDRRAYRYFVHDGDETYQGAKVGDRFRLHLCAVDGYPDWDAASARSQKIPP